MTEPQERHVPTITLSDGNKIPQVGLGVLRIDDEGVTPVVESAIAAGYRHIDGAAGYNNEAGVGRALANTGYNTGSNKARALLYDTTMAQWLRSNWNDTKKGTSPARAYGGVLVPDGKDENGDVIYRYAIKR